VNGGKWRKEKQSDIFRHQSLFFHTVSKLVQATVIFYDEIFQAVMLEGYVLLPEPFLTPPPPYIPDLAPLDIHVFGKLKKKTSPKPAISI
jgi:hypothetical protein